MKGLEITTFPLQLGAVEVIAWDATNVKAGTCENLTAGRTKAQNIISVFERLKWLLPEVWFLGLRSLFIDDKIAEVAKRDKDLAELLKRQLREEE